MSELPLVFKILGLPTKLFYDAFRHTQQAMSEGGTENDMSSMVGLKISVIVGLTGVIGVFQTRDARSFFFAILAFTGLSCAWQLRPFWRDQVRLGGQVPRPGIANWVLSHYGATSVLLDALGNGAMALYLGHAGFFSAFNGKAILGVALMIMWLMFNRFIFINLAVLELLKFHAGSRLRFSVLRRFQASDRSVEEGFDRRHLQVVLPAIGAFGKAFLPHNDSLSATNAGPNADSGEVNAQAKKALTFDNITWVSQVSALIGESDVAVFHWGKVLSDSMLIEYELAEKKLSLHRMILVVDQDAGALFDLSKRGCNLPMYVIAANAGYARFLSELRQVLRSMSASPVGETTPAETSAWSAHAWAALRETAKQRPEPGVLSGWWRLPETLGGAECELLVVDGHLMGRGQDDAGWFHIQGDFQRLEGGFKILATQRYISGRTLSFQGRSHDGQTIMVEVKQQEDAEMTFLQAS